MPRKLLRFLAHGLLGDYEIYRIYSQDLTLHLPAAIAGDYRYSRISAESLSSSPDPLIREQAWYLGVDCDAFGCIREGRILAVCFFWHGDRYRTERNFWPLKEGEAKLVQIVTLPEERGRGIASGLIAYAAAEMRARNFRHLYARVWHSNTPSIKAFERNGWSWLATVIVVRPALIGGPIRIKLRPHR